MRTSPAVSALLVLFAVSPATNAAPSITTVPFVGCAAEGQAGPLEPPKSAPRHVEIPARIAAQMAYYQAEQGRGVLGPRGWSCFAIYGSDGSSLFLTPTHHDGSYFFSDHRQSLSGPAIEYSGIEGGTSGRFGVAVIAARVFPRFRTFVEKVIAEELEPASDFRFGPFPADKLTYRSDHLVQFTTPAGKIGLGTQAWLVKGPGDITGFAWIGGEDTDVMLLRMRLPPTLATLQSTIIQQAEHEIESPSPTDPSNPNPTNP